MQRKVIQLAGKTYVVSLPLTWARHHHIKKGQAVEVQETPEGLLITPIKKDRQKTIELDITGITVALKRIIGALYKHGYTDITLRHGTPHQTAIIRDTLDHTCLGFEIVDQKGTTLTIKTITTLQEKDFDTVLRRLFLSAKLMVESLLQLSRHPSRAARQDIIKQDGFINKYADFCRRILNQRKESPALYHVVEEIERLGDAVKHLAPHYTATMKPVVRGMLASLDAYYGLFYAFDLPGSSAALQQTQKQRDALLLKKKLTPALVYCIDFFQILTDMYSSLYVLNLTMKASH